MKFNPPKQAVKKDVKLSFFN